MKPQEPENNRDNRSRNNPLGQRDVSPKVGGGIEKLEHGQSEDLVEQVRQKADQIHAEGKKPKSSQSEYDITGPDRQPGKVVRQEKLGTQPRKSQEGLYTQDNQEEDPKV